MKDAPRFPRTREFLTKTAVYGGLSLAALSPQHADMSTASANENLLLLSSNTRLTDSSQNAPIPDPIFDPSLEDPKTCLGSGESLPFIIPDKASIAQNGPTEVIICDLSGVGVMPNIDTLDQTLNGLGCILDTSRPARYFKYPNENPINTLTLPVTKPCVKPQPMGIPRHT